MAGYEQGQDVKVDIFKKGELIAVSGVSKGKGFAGVMKRHNFAGGPGGHGSMFNRRAGLHRRERLSVAGLAGQKTAGTHGRRTVTVKNLKIIEVRPEQNLLFVRGAVPGGENALVLITKG